MTLQQDKKLFSDTLRAAAQYLNVSLVFVEKDYWITLVLSRLAKSKHANVSVFKGGTSLSKGYNLIDRFSEDVDIAIINDDHKSGNAIKTIIRDIEKEVTLGLQELHIEGVTSKGSKFRKSAYEYASTEKNNRNNKLIVEINSFANPFPFQPLSINSMVVDFLEQTGNDKYIKEYNLQPFTLNVLNKEQTLLEKLVSLIRFSFDDNPVESVALKIRHFYDLYFLMVDSECIEFVDSKKFKDQFDAILNHDRDIFDEPKGWQAKPISNSPLLTDFSRLWSKLKGKYEQELSALAYRPIPASKDVVKCFQDLIERIK